MKTRSLVLLAALLCCRCAAPAGRERPNAAVTRSPAAGESTAASGPGPGAEEGGLAPVSSKFNPYKAYLKHVTDTVQREWDGLIAASNVYPPSRSYVVVRFAIDAQGRVVRIVAVENHSTALGMRLCLEAITDRAPFGEWAPVMRKTLNPAGEELKFTFYYQ